MRRRFHERRSCGCLLLRDEAAALVASYRILAPMNGIVSRVFKSPGEAVQVGESLLQCQMSIYIYQY